MFELMIVQMVIKKYCIQLEQVIQILIAPHSKGNFNSVNSKGICMAPLGPKPPEDSNSP